jgi:single-strand DNA-binding protein
MYFPMTSTLVGNVGQDAEIRQVTTPKGDVCVANFSIAINSGSGDDRQTQWVRVELWRNYAEAVAPLVKKGMKVTVEVRQVKLDAYTDKDGVARAALVVVADKLHLPSRNRDEDGDDTERDSDDIPF